MVVLGIESTAHTASVGLVDETAHVLGIASDMHRPVKGGIHPREAANHHVEIFPALVEQALTAASVKSSEVEAVAFAQGPGLGPCLRAGATVARMLSLAWDRPLVPVNHCVAHVEIARVLSGLDDPLLLYASGGNTQVIAYGRGRYRVLGETLDIGIGNFLDKLWIELGGTFPGGPATRAGGQGRVRTAHPSVLRPRNGRRFFGNADGRSCTPRPRRPAPGPRVLGRGHRLLDADRDHRARPRPPAA